ncbi:MAG: hypothetical protein JNL61_18360 [Rhizobiaceae bacterium]|nr:hypothetical protein [Rhizobiaceae bacterium]
MLRSIDTPMRLLDTPGGAEVPPPLLGQHTREILTSLGGLSDREVA